jgi:hypothetical protein
MTPLFAAWISVIRRWAAGFQQMARWYRAGLVGLAAIGFALPAIAINWNGSIELAAPIAAAALFATALLFVIALSFCLALERTLLSKVELTEVRFDALHRIFYIDVRNGNVPVTLDIRINSVIDSKGRRCLEHSWRGHWRGHLATHPGRLTESEGALYGLLAFGDKVDGHPYLFIYSDDPARPNIANEIAMPGNRSYVKITQTLDASENWPFRAELLVVGETDDGNRRHLRTIKFTVDREGTSEEFIPILTNEK